MATTFVVVVIVILLGQSPQTYGLLTGYPRCSKHNLRNS